MHWKFFNKEIDDWEEVESVEWCWEAHYNDNTILKQYDDEGIFHRFSEIDQSRLIAFKMVSKNNPQVFTLIFDPDMKLIHFYKVYRKTFDPNFKLRFYCFGYEMNGNKVINIITPDNELITTDNLDKIKFI